jgi:hypothetical protein
MAPGLKVNGTNGEDKKGERKGEAKKKDEELKDKKNSCGKSALVRNGEKKNGLGKKNGSEKKGEKKNGSGKKNVLAKNGEKKNGRGNKNGLRKNGLKLGKNGLKKENCREEKGPATSVQRAAHCRREWRDAYQLKSSLELAHLESVADALQRQLVTEQAQLQPAVGGARLNSRRALAWLKSVVDAAQLKYDLSRKGRAVVAVVIHTGAVRPELVTGKSLRKEYEVPSSLKPRMVGTECERGNPENAGGLTEKRET